MTAAEPTERDPRRLIAVTAVAGRFPGAASVEELWQNLRAGVESISFFAPDELAASGVDPALGRDPCFVPAGGVLAGAELFDAALFGINPREAELLDPQHRILLECAWEALERAGHDPRRFAGRIGVFASASLSTYFLHNLLPGLAAADPAAAFQALIANDKDFAASRISYKLGLKGPSLMIQSGCSSSLAAVHLAVQSLVTNECDLALAGGATVSVPQRAGYLAQEGMILAPDGHCRPFDADAAGTVPASGVAMVVLRRLEDAVRDGDPLHAVVLGSAINNDGSLKLGYTAPSVQGQAEVIAEAIGMAGVEPSSLSYVEGHGSGTLLGDPIEVAALNLVFGPRSAGPGTCLLGSIKGNIGHLDAAAGVAGLVKVVLALEHGLLPPSPSFKRPNPHIDFARGPFHVNTEPVPWPATGTPRRAGVSSFGIGGTNVHVVLEEAPRHPPAEPDPRPQVLVLSARTPSALDAATAALVGHLEAHPEVSLADVAFTLQLGRVPLPHRRAVVAADVAAASAALARLDPARVFSAHADRDDAPVVFLFPDAGWGQPGFWRDLDRSEPVFRERLDSCRRGLEKRGLALGAGLTGGDDGPLPAPGEAEPTVFAVEYALAHLLMHWGIEPAGAIGWGVGELAAACVAGALDLGDVLTWLARTAGEGGSRQRHLQGGTPRFALMPARTGRWTRPGEAYVPPAGARTGSVPLPALAGDDFQALAGGRAVVLGPPPWACPGALAGLDAVPLPVLAALADPPATGPLGAVAQLWAHGISPRWPRLHRAGRQRLVLPTYPFERKAYWVEPPRKTAGPKPAAGLPPGRRRDLADWLYLPAWRPLLPAPRPSEEALRARSASWLLLGDPGGIGASLAARLVAAGHDAYRVDAGERFGQIGERRFVLRPGSRPDWEMLARTLGDPPEHVVHTWGLEPGAPFAVQLERGFQSLIALAAAFGPATDGAPTRLTVVTAGALAVTEQEPLQPGWAGVGGPCLVIPQEYPGFTCRHLDVAAEDLARRGASDPDPVNRLLAELIAEHGESSVACRGRQRWADTYVPARLDAALLAASPYRTGGAYLVTGGTTGVGAAIARSLAAHGGARLVLLEPIDGGGDTPDLVPGAPVVRADLSSPGELLRAVAEAERLLGALDGVLHAAGFGGEATLASIAEMDPEQATRSVALRHAALAALDQALDERELDFVAVQSSLAAVLGGVGLVTHSAASRVADAFVAERNRCRARPWIAIDWNNWRLGAEGEGDADRSYMESALAPLAVGPGEGAEALARILAAGAVGRVVVSTADLEARRKQRRELGSSSGEGEP